MNNFIPHNVPSPKSLIELNGNVQDLQYILSTQAIRDRAQKIYELAKAGKTHFEIDESKLDYIAQVTATVTRENYPDLKIPFHSRWKHFNVGGIPRVSALNAVLSSLSKVEAIYAKLDLAVVSVLLDAGAGMKWRYTEKGSDTAYSKSEGLAVASLHMFLAGAFSSNPKNHFQVDSGGLKNLEFKTFLEHFQVSDENPLVGAQGRFELLKSLARVLESKEKFFGKAPAARPGKILEHLRSVAKNNASGSILATDILSAVQQGLGEIWPGRVLFNDFNLGDVWPYPPLGSGFQSLVPFHKLSQWLSYSMVDPILESGLEVTGFEQLSALAEYRNGGLLIDGGVLRMRDYAEFNRSHHPSSELMVEWRALTVVLMEPLAERVRAKLGKTADELPLGKILEGGTWWAGRKLALERRKDGGSPISIESDGTVF